MPNDAVADELAILRTLARYCHTCDDGDFDALVALFTPDGTFTYLGTEATGRDGLTAFFVAAQPPGRRGKHLTTNVVVHVVDDRADVTSDFVFLAHDGGALVPRVAGRYRDRLVRGENGWLIEQRDASPLAPPG